MNQSEQPASTQDSGNEETAEWATRSWEILTSAVSHTFAGVLFAIPGFLLAAIIATIWPEVWKNQYLGFYLIAMLTMVFLVLMEDLGTTGEDKSSFDTSNLSSGQLLRLIAALVLSTSAMVSIRLIVATIGAVTMTSILGSVGLPAVITAISIAVIDHETAKIDAHLSIGGLAGLSVLWLMSLVGLQTKEKKSIQEINMPVGTAR